MKQRKSFNRPVLAPALGVAWGLVIVMLLAATLGAAPLGASSAQPRAASADRAAGICPSGDTTTTIWPTLATLSPASASAGDTVRVTGRGGYLRCSDGTYDESARNFTLEIAGRPLAPLQCYVNYCQTDAVLPADLQPGAYAIIAEGGSQLALTIQQRRSLDFHMYLPQVGGRHASSAPNGSPTPTISAGHCGPNDAYEIIWPSLTNLDPTIANPGSSVRVTGRGGYLRCSDGTYDESARTFTLEISGQSLAPISCYVNYCQGQITVPGILTPGVYQVIAQGGSHLPLTVHDGPPVTPTRVCPVPFAPSLLTATPSHGTPTPLPPTPTCPMPPPCGSVSSAMPTGGPAPTQCPTPPTTMPTYPPNCPVPFNAGLLTPTPSHGTPTNTPTPWICPTLPPCPWINAAMPTSGPIPTLCPRYTPTWTPTHTPTRTATSTATWTTICATPWPGVTATPCPTWTPTATPPVWSCPTPWPGVTATPCATWTPTGTPPNTPTWMPTWTPTPPVWSCPTPWPGVTATPCATWTPTPTSTPTPASAVPMRVLGSSGIPCSSNWPSTPQAEPPRYSMSCALSAGHSAGAELRYFADSAALAAAFETLRNGAPLETFHGRPAFYRTSMDGMNKQVFAWQGDHWLITMKTEDDTPYLGQIRTFAERTHTSAAAYNLEAYVP